MRQFLNWRSAIPSHPIPSSLNHRIEVRIGNSIGSSSSVLGAELIQLRDYPRTSVKNVDISISNGLVNDSRNYNSIQVHLADAFLLEDMQTKDDYQMFLNPISNT